MSCVQRPEHRLTICSTGLLCQQQTPGEQEPEPQPQQQVRDCFAVARNMMMPLLREPTTPSSVFTWSAHGNGCDDITPELRKTCRMVQFRYCSPSLSSGTTVSDEKTYVNNNTTMV